MNNAPEDNVNGKTRVFLLPLNEIRSGNQRESYETNCETYGLGCIERSNVQSYFHSLGYSPLNPEAERTQQESQLPAILKQNLFQRFISFLFFENERLERRSEPASSDKVFYFEFNSAEAAQLFAKKVNSEKQYRAVIQ